jgi:predicted ATPase
MAVARVEVENFRSIESLSLDLRSFNVLIGANASGKSNLLQVFKFLRDISQHGLENAISMQGGVKFLRNIQLGAGRDLRIGITFDTPQFIYQGPQIRSPRGRHLGLQVNRVVYGFRLSFNKHGSGYRISSDTLEEYCSLVRLESRGRRSMSVGDTIGQGIITFTNRNGRLDVSLDLPQESPFKQDDILPRIARPRLLGRRSLLIEERLLFFIPPWSNLFDFGMYDFDPKLSKKAIPVTGRAELEEDGSNLAIVLDDVLRTRENRRKFSNLMSDLLPFMSAIDVENVADKSLLVKLAETYTEGQYLPATFVSDGTIDIASFITALYFQDKDVVIIEEPERNIHPSLIAKQMEVFKDAAVGKQVIISTHNPLVVRYADPSDIILIFRNEAHFTSAARVQNSEMVARFLEEDYPLEDLFVDNLLTAVI